MKIPCIATGNNGISELVKNIFFLNLLKGLPMFKNTVSYTLAGMAFLLAVLFYLFNSSNDPKGIQGDQPSLPSDASKFKQLSYIVDPNFMIPSVQRLGVNISSCDASGNFQGIKNIFNTPDRKGDIHRMIGAVAWENPQKPQLQEIVNRLKTINPSYLRLWQGEAADAFGFKYFGKGLWNPGKEAILNSSLLNFLNLCTQLGANPWILISPRLSKADLKAL